MTAGWRNAPRWLKNTVYLIGSIALFAAIGIVLYFGAEILFIALLWLDDDREAARIAGPNGLEIVILDTSRGATTGFSYAFVIVSAGKAADRDQAVAFLSGPSDVKATWNGTSAIVCADHPKIWHYQNFYSARVDNSYRKGDVSLRTLGECQSANP